MPDIAFDLRYLRYALLAAEYGSFRRTAEMLSVSQSTVSRRIQILERRIGMPLFERHGSGARVTPAGERFLRDAAIGAKHLNQAVDIAAQVKRGSTGMIRVGLTACLANGFLAELIADYHRRFPGIEVRFEEGTTETSISGLLNGRLDVAFTLASLQLPGCRAERLWDEKVYVAVPAWHAIASLKEVTWDDVGQESFVVTADAGGPDIEDYLVRQLTGSGVRPRISVQHISCDNLLGMVAQGFGATLATSPAGGTIHPGVRFVPIAERCNTFSFSAVWSSGNQNPALKFLIKMGLERRMKTRC
ncbi:LysR family transcriptional regulator [Nitrospirillum sp. BR 11164]|uniref:LysR family transcriptional regulator n=1 Tax=Nitrospirillum sp. BR 11164 TaxID=3104324 RepID=UPI002AFE1916|nr:LysR family transcriptional regulator [Nitrospirillum sp. BR 11164]MEA1651285.1 LysR family transcriptional regulator [Nitrospirillum sp. BR 11164]